MDHGHGGDHSYGHAGGGTSYGHVGPGDHHGPGVNGHHAGGGDHGGDHGGFANHDLSIAHAGDFFGHSGSIAFEGLVFMAFLDWAGGHHSHNVGYSFHNSGVNIVHDMPHYIDGVGGGTGIGTGRGIRGGNSRLRPTAVRDVKAQSDSKLFIVHAHNIGDPNLPQLMKVWPERLGLVNITDYPSLGGVKEGPLDTVLSWDWGHPADLSQLPAGWLPGVRCKSRRFKQVYQIGMANPKLSWLRRAQLYLKVGAPPRRGELIPNTKSNVVVEVYGSEWVYEQTGTAEVKLEVRVKPNLRYYPNPGLYAVVAEPYRQNRDAALELAKILHRELSGYKRTPGKLEEYLEMLSKLPGSGTYRPPVRPDGVAPGTPADERELEELEVEQNRTEDRASDSQLPTTLPTTPATPVTPGPTVDGLPPTPDSDTGAAVDGLPAYSGLAPSAPGSVTADLALPAAAPMPGTQIKVNGQPTKSVDEDGVVEVHVPLGDFHDYHGHQA